MGASHSASLSNSATRLSLASPIEEGRKDNVPKADRFPLVLQRMFGGGSQSTCQQAHQKDALLQSDSRDRVFPMSPRQSDGSPKKRPDALPDESRPNVRNGLCAA